VRSARKIKQSAYNCVTTAGGRRQYPHTQWKWTIKVARPRDSVVPGPPQILFSKKLASKAPRFARAAGGVTFFHDNLGVLSLAIASLIRATVVSRPNTASVSKSGGAFLRPHTATRIG